MTRADVSDLAQVDRLFQEVETHMGGLDILINNIGISGPTAAVENVSVADWQATLSVNLNSYFNFVYKAVPLLKTAEGGSIISIASTAGLMGYPMRAPYAASKWAVIGLTKTLAMELVSSTVASTPFAPALWKGRAWTGLLPPKPRRTILHKTSCAKAISPRRHCAPLCGPGTLPTWYYFCVLEPVNGNPGRHSAWTETSKRRGTKPASALYPRCHVAIDWCLIL